jgi:hypothetical protein
MAGVKLLPCHQCKARELSGGTQFKPRLVEFPYTWTSPLIGEAHGWHVICGNPGCRQASRAILAVPKAKSAYPKYRDAAREEWNRNQRLLEIGEAHRLYWLGQYKQAFIGSFEEESKFVEKWFADKYGDDWRFIVNNYGEARTAESPD